MQHSMRIRVTKHPISAGIVACRTLSVREKLLRLILGTPQKLTIIVPGDSVDEIAVTEIGERSAAHEAIRD